jgi:hypothetical protein
MNNLSMHNKAVTHYRLSDGRFWSVAETSFVDATPEGAIVGDCAIGGDGSAESGLVACLKFFGYPLGALKSDEDYAFEAREKRNALIAETDYMAMPDYPLDEERKAAVLAYRQALRDVPEQKGFPRQIDWPVKP